MLKCVIFMGISLYLAITRSMPQHRPAPWLQPRLCEGDNLEWRECGSACPESCQSNFPSCPLQCIAGCYCVKPFILDTGTNTCVLKEDCPNEQVGYCEKPHTVWKVCGSPCPKTCQHEVGVGNCSQNLCETGCFCQLPYILDESTNSCMLERDCPLLGIGA